MKKFWWSVFFGALFGILLLFPETNFSYRVFNLAHALQLSVVQIIGLLALNTSILAGFFGVLWGTIAQPYLSERAKNLATKHDVSAITREVEEVKHQYQKLAEDHKHKNLLRMAAIDERLSVHQEAYSIWGKLVLWDKVEDEEDRFSHMDLLHWWKDHNLYLEPESREAFRDMTSGYYQVRSLSDEGMTDEEAWEKIWEAGTVIETSIGLPPIDIRRDVLKA